jgi:hypothetical protein
MAELDPEEQTNLLIAMGDYLHKMHEITFEFPGYLSSLSGPTEPPDPNGWSAKTRETNACDIVICQIWKPFSFVF